MPASLQELEVASDFELIRPLPPFETRLRKSQAVELLREAVRLQRLSRYIVLVAVAAGTPSSLLRDPKKPVLLSQGAEQMVAGGSVPGHQADGIILALDAVAPRLDAESWSSYTALHLEMPQWLTDRIG